MNRRATITSRRLVVMAVLTFAAFADAGGQRATEQYIPIGSSPGVSGRQSYIGEIIGLDFENRSLTIQEEDGNDRHTVRLTADTEIWLDRSASGRSNIDGRIEDLEVGRRVEVMFAEREPTAALWIKVQTP